MRTITYAVINRKTKEKMYRNIDYRKCEEFIANSTNKENLVIGYKWMSI